MALCIVNKDQTRLYKGKPKPADRICICWGVGSAHPLDICADKDHWCHMHYLGENWQKVLEEKGFSDSTIDAVYGFVRVCKMLKSKEK